MTSREAFDFEAAIFAIARLHGHDAADRVEDIVKTARDLREIDPKFSIAECVHDAIVLVTPLLNE